MAFNISAVSCWTRLWAVTSWLNSSITCVLTARRQRRPVGARRRRVISVCYHWRVSGWLAPLGRRPVAAGRCLALVGCVKCTFRPVGGVLHGCPLHPDMLRLEPDHCA